MRGYYSKRKNEDLGNIQSQSSILLKANQFDLFGWLFETEVCNEYIYSERQKLHLMQEYETPRPLPKDLIQVTKTSYNRKWILNAC